MNGKFNLKIDTIRNFFSKNSGHFFNVQKYGREGLLISPLVAGLSFHVYRKDLKSYKQQTPSQFLVLPFIVKVCETFLKTDFLTSSNRKEILLEPLSLPFMMVMA